MKTTAVVILNYRNWPDTIECLQSLMESACEPTSIIVVDNDSRNASLTHIQHWLSERNLPAVLIAEPQLATSGGSGEQLILLQASSNRGYAAGNNLGIRVALARGADYILILNNDTLVEKGFLEPLIDYAEARENVGMVGPKLVSRDGHLQPGCARRRPTPGDYFFRLGLGKTLFPNNRWIRRHYYRGEYNFERPKQVDILSGACMLLKARVLQKIGLLDENTFLYLEEFILHEKLRAAGFTAAVVPASRVVHKGGGSTAEAPSPVIHQAHRASLRYYLSHYRQFGPITVALLMLACSDLSDFLPKRVSLR
jgi:N-acetylglucosaminyl-diphospho-decaprenol L-rhamnosyltransferase